MAVRARGGVRRRKFGLARIVASPSARPIIEFLVANEARIALSVIDVTGREVARLADGIREPGRYRVSWDGRSNGATAGIYFVRYEGGGKTFVRRLVLLR